MAQPTPNPELRAQPPQGIPRRTLIIIGVVMVFLWFVAIKTGSWIPIVIVGILTALVGAAFIWYLRLMKRQQGLVSLLEGAVNSKEARKAAIEKLAADKDSKDPTKIFARAQLEAAEDPAQALKTIEAVPLKDFPAAMQDEVSLLRCQLYLFFGRIKDALPLADRIFVDNPQKKDARPMMVALVGEVWGRGGKHTEALNLLGTVDPEQQKLEVKAQLIGARVFANFAAGKKAAARKDLERLADLDPNYLGRFALPKFKAHPELQRITREVAEKNPQIRRMARAQQRPSRGPRFR